jgi:hypothetical protein
MGKLTFDKIKKTLTILLAVFLVVTLTAASASACASKTAKSPVNKVVGAPDASGLTEEQKTALGNQLLDMADNNWFGNGIGNGCNSCNNNGLFDNGFDNGCDNGCDNGLGNDWFGW